MPYRMMEMTWPQIAASLSSGCRTVVATFGAVEQHGHHLPLGTDAYWGEALGERVACQLGDALLAPALRIGCSEHHMAFPGSFTLRTEVFVAVVTDYVSSLVRHGFVHIVLLPTHGGNFAPLQEAVDQIRPRFPAANIIAYTDLVALIHQMKEVAAAAGINPDAVGGHADHWETSVILALHPHLVQMEQAEAGYMGDMHAALQRVFTAGFQAVTANGVIGDPTGAQAAVGERYLTAMTETIIAYIRNARAQYERGDNR